MKKILSSLFLFFFALSFSQQRAIKPKIMIIPSDVWMNENNYTTTEEVQGVSQKTYNYGEAFSNSALLNDVVNSTGGKFADRGFNLTQMSEAIKAVEDRIKRNNITGRTLSLLDELALEVSADIILRVDFNIKGASLGRKIVDRFSMTAVDAYSQENLGKAGLPGAPSVAESESILVLERVEAFINNLEGSIKRVFQGYVENGRKARIEIMVNPDAVDFGCYDYYGTELSDGTFLYEYFENWAVENGFKGQGYAEPSPSGESVNLYINIPLVNDKGRAVRALNYATLFLRDANFRSLYKMRPEQVGLGHAILKIEDCK